MKRTIIMIVMIATLFTSMIFFSYTKRQKDVRSNQPDITGKYGVTIDANTGKFCTENGKKNVLIQQV